VACPRPSTLVRRETWFPGWSVQLDGHPAVLRHADELFQAVAVPRGTHRVTFTYSPPGMEWALLGLLAGCGLMLVPTVRPRGRRTRVLAR